MEPPVAEDMPAQRPHRSALHRWRRRVSYVVLAVVASLLAVVLLVWAILETEQAAVRFVDTAIPWVNDVIPGEVRFSDFSGTLGHRLVLDDIEILDDKGEICVQAKRLEVDWNVWDLANFTVDVSRVLVVAPQVLVGFREDGSLNLTTAFVPEAEEEEVATESSGPSRWSVEIRSVQLEDGGVEVHLPATAEGAEAVEIEGDQIQIEASYTLQGGNHDIAIGGLSVRPRKPFDLAPVRLEGMLALDGMDLVTDGLSMRWKANLATISGRVEDLRTPRVDVRLDAKRFDLADLRVFAPDLPLQGALSLTLDAQGPFTDLAFAGQARTAQGAVVDFQEGRIVLSGETAMHGLKLSATDLTVSEFVQGLDKVPEKLSFQLGWEGSGLRPENIKGDVVASVSPVVYSGLELSLVDARAHWEDRTARLEEARLGVSGGWIDLSGEASFRDLLFDGSVAADLPELSPFSELAGVALEGSLRADAVVNGRWGTEAPVSLQTRGQAGLEQIQVPELRAASARLDWDLSLDLVEEELPRPVGPVTMELVSPRLEGGFALDRLSLEGQFQGDRVQCSISAARASSLLARFEGEVDWSALPSLLVRGEQLDLLAGEQLVQTTSPFTARTREGSFELNRFALDFQPGTLMAQVVYEPGRSSIRSLLQLRGVELQQLVTLRRAVLGLEGAGLGESEKPLDTLSGQVKDLRVKLDGSLSAPRIEVSSRVRDLQLGPRGPLGMELSLLSEGGNLSGQFVVSDLLTLGVDKVPLTVRLDGKGLPAVLSEQGDWQLALDVGEVAVAAFEPLLGRSLPETVSGGSVRGRVTVSGPTAALAVRGNFGLSELSVSDHRVQGQLSLVLEEDEFSLDGSRLKTAAAGRVLEFEGRAAAPVGEFLLGRLGPRKRRTDAPVPLFNDLELGARVRKLPMALVHPILPVLSPVTGALQGRLSLTGELADPLVDLEVRLLGGRVGREALKRTELKAGIKGGRLSSLFEMDPETGGALRVTTASSLPLHLGKLPKRRVLLGTEDLEIGVDGKGFPLAMVAAFVPGATDAEGEVQLQGSVTGSLGSPHPSLALSLASGRICHETTSVCYEDLVVESKLEGNRAELGRLSLTTVPQVRNPLDLLRSASAVGDKSRLSLEGFVLLEGLTPRWTQLDLHLERAWASYSEQIRVQMDGDLKLRGYSPSLRLTGDLELPTVRLDLGRSDTRREIQPLELPGNLSVHRVESQPGPGEWQPEAEDDTGKPSFLDRLRAASEVELDIHLGNNVQVALAVGIAGQRSQAVQALNLMGSIEPDLKLGGDLSLRWQRGEPTLVGRIAMERGSALKVLTRSFTMDDESFVEFVGRVPDSQLSLRATHSSRYGPVSVRVSERMASPSIRFESEVFEDQADILSILLTGKPMTELSTAEGSQALSGMAGTLAGFGTKAFGKYTPLDSLDVDLGDDISTGSAEAGKALGPRVFLITRFRWGAEEGENRVEGQLEVQITPRLYLETVIGDRLQGAAELVWKKQF